jgi:uncharacterized membrane protein YeaQ/YmgE (transglycosylase-associated protein family)
VNFVWWIIVGFVAGVLAKLLMPGSSKEPKGCLLTIVLGIVGSVLVGWLMTLLGMQGSGGLIGTVIGATIGAMVLILLMRKFWA